MFDVAVSNKGIITMVLENSILPVEFFFREVKRDLPTSKFLFLKMYKSSLELPSCHCTINIVQYAVVEQN